jgi:hypothetical protein
MGWRRPRGWWFRFGGLVALAALLACVSTPEWDPIAPSEFHFVPIVAPQGMGPGGWKAARLLITLARQDGHTFKPVLCKVQVEVPEINFRGPVTDEYAQSCAATASDQAADRVLRQNFLSAELCKRYHLEMERILRELIPGARVKDFADYPGAPQRR